MRASRLLRILMILQNRGRQTTAALAAELEVARRTVLRDIDAMTEAGLPIITHAGHGGGVELGFDYRSQLTGLDRDEAQAIGVALSFVPAEVAALGMGPALRRAQAKMAEAFPDQTRAAMAEARVQFPLGDPAPLEDPRLPALAEAIRNCAIVRLQSRSGTPVVTHPVGLSLDRSGWVLCDALRPDAPWPMADWGDINISSIRYRSPQ